MELQSGAPTEEGRRRYLYWHERDLRGIPEEIREKGPDLIITDISPKSSWLRQKLSAMEPDFLDANHVVAEEGGIRVYRLKASIPAVR
jgi:hypothetical protein